MRLSLLSLICISAKLAGPVSVHCVHERRFGVAMHFSCETDLCLFAINVFNTIILVILSLYSAAKGNDELVPSPISPFGLGSYCNLSDLRSG